MTKDLRAMTSIYLLQSFTDAATDEEFYCCAWSCNIDTVSTNRSSQGSSKDSAAKLASSRQQILAVAGKRGVIRILCPSLTTCLDTLIGHGQAVNELKFHPIHPQLLFSFSKGNPSMGINRFWIP